LPARLRRRSAKSFERGLHLVPSMDVARLRRYDNSIRKHFGGLFHAPEPRQQLAELIVAGHVFGMRFEELLEVAEGGLVVSQLHAFEREAVARESIRGPFRDELLEDFTARLLCLGHGTKARIIAASMGNRKSRMAKTGKKQAAAPRESPQGSPAALPKSQGKPVSASRSELVEIVLPNDANPLGNMLGGRVMHLIDIAGALTAGRHSNSYVVTASVDYLDFRFPVQVGQFLVLKASVNRVFQTSMEVGVKVFTEDILTGRRQHTSSAYLTYVALDMNRRPHPAPLLILETDVDRRRFNEAGERRRARLTTRHKGALPRP